MADDRSFDLFDASPVINKEPSYYDLIKANVQEAFSQAETSNIVNFFEKSVADSETPFEEFLQPEEANAQAPFLDVPIVDPISPRKLDILVDNHNERMKRQAVIAKGAHKPGAGALGLASAFTTALDPVGLTVGVATGSMLGRLVGHGLKGSKALRLGREIGENVAGNVVAEFAINQPISQQERTDLTSKDALFNAVAGGVAAPVVLKGIKGFYRGLTNLAPEKLGKAYDYVHQKMAMGKNPNLELDEMEAITRARETEFNTRIDEINAREDLDPTAKQNQIELVQKEAQEFQDQLGSREQISERQTSQQRDMYYDSDIEAVKQRYELDQDAVELDPVARNKEEIDAVTQDSFEDLNEAEAAEINTIREGFDENLKTVDETLDKYQLCVRGQLG